MPNQNTPKKLTKINALRQALLWHRGHVLPYRAIEDVMWGDDEDGGPLDIRNTIHVYVTRLRNEGYDIEAWYGRGLQLND